MPSNIKTQVACCCGGYYIWRRPPAFLAQLFSSWQERQRRHETRDRASDVEMAVGAPTDDRMDVEDVPLPDSSTYVLFYFIVVVVVVVIRTIA